MGIVVAFAFIGTFVLLKITDLISPLAVSEEEETSGLDASQHDETIIMGNPTLADFPAEVR